MERLVFILLLLTLVGCLQNPIPENCITYRGERVYDVAIQDTVVVYYKMRNNTGNIEVRNQYGQMYMLKCGEYKLVR